MLEKVSQYIAKHNLLTDGTYLVALSGGADSVCLFRMMLSLGYRVEAVHCNFRLRGEESDRDELFCESLCRDFDVKLHKVHFDTKEYAVLHKVSIEMAARELRYTYFEQLRKSIDASGILVAHHRDDSIETVLLNLVRGTGIRGLEGIKPVNGHIIRPLLCLSREEILSYLHSCGQNYIVDSSNLIDDVKRNKLRLNVIPLLKSITPSALENIATTSQHVAEAVKVYDASIAQSISECFHDHAVNIPLLLRQPSPEAVLHELLSRYDVPSKMVQQIFCNLLSAPTGKKWEHSPYMIVKDRDALIIDKMPTTALHLVMPECGRYRHGADESALVTLELKERSEDFQVSKEPMYATLDADKVHFPLTIRQMLTGDRFTPYGMNSSKLLSDYLTDKKRNLFQRSRQLVLHDATGTILWVVGERVAKDASVTPDTIKVLCIRYSKE